MAIIVREAYKSRKETVGDQDQEVRLYIAAGSDDKSDLKAAVLGEAPAASDDGLRLRTVTDDQIAPEVWKYTLTYSSKKREDNTSSFSFDTTGGTVHKDIAIDQEIYEHHEYVAPDFKNAIGVDADGNVAGVDVIVPAFSYQETHYLNAEDVTETYAKTLATLTGSVNDDTFKGWAAGEVRFDGATGSQDKPGGQWQVTFKFTMEPNIEIEEPGDITGGPIEKDGHEYLWTYFHEEKDTTANRMVPAPHAVVVSQVYPLADFSLIGIGV